MLWGTGIIYWVYYVEDYLYPKEIEINSNNKLYMKYTYKIITIDLLCKRFHEFLDPPNNSK